MLQFLVWLVRGLHTCLCLMSPSRPSRVQTIVPCSSEMFRSIPGWSFCLPFSEHLRAFSPFQREREMSLSVEFGDFFWSNLCFQKSCGSQFAMGPKLLLQPLYLPHPCHLFALELFGRLPQLITFPLAPTLTYTDDCLFFVPLLCCASERDVWQLLLPSLHSFFLHFLYISFLLHFLGPVSSFCLSHGDPVKMSCYPCI